MKQLRHHKLGFGLLEVMLSVAIFIVVVGSLVSLTRLSFRNAVVGAHRTQAYNLAQDALETVRQMRDTNWIDQAVKVSSTGQPYEEKDQWLAFNHDCQGSAAGSATHFDPIQVGTAYEICFDTINGLNRFGLRPAPANELNPAANPSTFIVFKGADNQPDPSSPLWFKRTISFETVPSTAASVIQNPFPGLQILGADGTNNPALLFDAEASQFIKVKTTVEWLDFDQRWKVDLSTILTNWRRK